MFIRKQLEEHIDWYKKNCEKESTSQISLEMLLKWWWGEKVPRDK